MQAIKKGHLSTVVRALELFFLVIISIKRREAFSEGGLGNLCAHHAALSPFSQWGDVVGWNRCLWDSGVGTSCIKQEYHQFHSFHIAIFLFHFFFYEVYHDIVNYYWLSLINWREQCPTIVPWGRHWCMLSWSSSPVTALEQRYDSMNASIPRTVTMHRLMSYAFSGDYVRRQAHTISTIFLYFILLFFIVLYHT